MKSETSESWSTTTDDFLAGLRERDGADEDQLSLVRRCLDLYSGLNLLPGDKDVALHECCANRKECWGGISTELANPRHGGVAAPWVGPGYAEAPVRIMAVSQNLANWGGLDGHWFVGRENVARLAEGRTAFAGTNGEWVGRCVRLMMASYLGEPLPDYPNQGDASTDRPELAKAWNQCCFTEAVKCSPAREGCTPTEHMFSTCPSFLLKEEIEILDPHVVVLLSRRSQGPVAEALGKSDPWVWGGAIDRWAFPKAGGRNRELFALANRQTGKSDLRTIYSRVTARLEETPVGQFAN